MKELIWYEKHRPSKLKAMVLPEDSKALFDEWISGGEIPHLIFYGPRGSGKTSLSKILISECAGKSLILNASSEDRGINTVKTRIKNFARGKTTDRKNIILLDEADGLTPDAQIALKNTIETNQKNCRFILTANNVNKIIEELQSRCIPFKFDELKPRKIFKIVKRILAKEEVEYKRKKDIDKLIEEYSPDIRSIINRLQAGSIGGAFDLKKALSFAGTSVDKKVLAQHIKDGNIGLIRGLFSGMNDFIWLYEYLADVFVQEIQNKYAAEVMLHTAEYMYRDRFTLLKEINAAACLVEIMLTINVKVNFDVTI